MQPQADATDFYVAHLPPNVRTMADIDTIRRVRTACDARGQVIHGPLRGEFIAWCRCDVLDVGHVFVGRLDPAELVTADKRHAPVLFVLDALALTSGWLFQTVRHLSKSLLGVSAVAAIHAMSDGKFHLRYRRVHHVAH